MGDHSVLPVSFVWMATPINAGFYLTELPSNAVYPATLSLRDANGNLLAKSEPLTPPQGPRSLQ
jgi:hypothetical protein